MVQDERTKPTKRRRAAWILLAFLAFLVLIPQVAISTLGAGLAASFLTSTLAKPVRIQTVSGGWWEGLQVRGLTVSDSFEAAAKPLLGIGRITVAAPIWMLLFPGSATDVVLDDVRLELRHLANGEWNVADLQPTGEVELPEKLFLPGGAIRFRLNRGRVYVEPEDREYTLTANADSPSLKDQAAEWRIEIADAGGESLSASGSFVNLATPHQLAGTVKVEMTHFDLGIIPALVPGLPPMYPEGIVESGSLRLSLTGIDRFRAVAAVELSNVSLPDVRQDTAATLKRASVQLAVSRSNEKWTIETASLESPHGVVALEPGGWFAVSREAWQGKLDFNARLDDAGPGSRALAMFFPDPLGLGGRLSIKASMDGQVSRNARMDLDERIAKLKAGLNMTLAEARWRRAQLKDIAIHVALDNGRLTVPQIAATVGKGHVSLEGELTVGPGPEGGLRWLATEVPLADALGAPVKTFDVTRAQGHVTFNGETYNLESQTAVRELDFDRAELDNRTFRISDARLDCSGTLPSDLSRFETTSCRLEATQGHLQSDKGAIQLGAKPGLTINLNGWLGGPFLTGLVPELRPKWPRQIRVNGDIMVPFRGETWINMEWQLDASGKELAYEGAELSNLRGRVTKSVGRLDLDISGTRGAGSLAANGSLKLGTKSEMTLVLKAIRLPIHRDLPGSYSLEGMVSGAASVSIDARGARGSLDNHLTGVKLHHGGKVVARLQTARLQGDLQRTGRGRLWARNLSLVGPQLELKIRDSHLPLARHEKGTLELNLDFVGDGSWLALASTLGGLDGVAASGASQMSLRLQGDPGGALDSLRGTGKFTVPRLSLWGQPFEGADMSVELQPGELKVARGVVRYKRGKVTLDGNVIFPLPKSRRSKEHLVIRLEQVPVSHTQTLSSYEGQGPATLITETRLSGKILLNGLANSQLAMDLDIRAGAISRRVYRRDKRLAEVKLPDLQISSRLVSGDLLRAWRIDSLEVHAQGLSIALTRGRVTRRESGYEIIATLAAELSPEFLRPVTMELWPPGLNPGGQLTASGQTKWRIPLTEPFSAKDVGFTGTVGLQELKVNADTWTDLRGAVRLADGRLDIERGEASLLGGRVWLPGPSRIDLLGPEFDFNVHAAAKNLRLRTYGGRRASLGHFLGLLIPVFLFTSHSEEKPISVTGVLQTELQLAGTYQDTPGWSRSVNGTGSFRIEDGAVVGSSLVSGIIAKSLLLPTNIVHNSVAALFSKDGKVGRALAGLGSRAFTFQTIASPITVRNGDIFLAQNLKVSSPEVTLTINGHSNLEGGLDYDVGTDLIRRVRLGEITSLPNKIPIIGKAISFLNPFTYLEGIELRARVTGNLLKTGPDGKSDVHVHTSVVDTKRG